MSLRHDIAGPLLLAVMLLLASLCGEGPACVHSLCVPGQARDLLKRAVAAVVSTFAPILPLLRGLPGAPLIVFGDAGPPAGRPEPALLPLRI